MCKLTYFLYSPLLYPTFLSSLSFLISPPPLSSLIPTQTEWEEVRREMVEEKGLAGEVADRIGEYVKLHGGLELLEKLCADTQLVAVKAAEEGLSNMRLLLHYCDLFGVLDKVCVYVGREGEASVKACRGCATIKGEGGKMRCKRKCSTCSAGVL